MSENTKEPLKNEKQELIHEDYDDQIIFAEEEELEDQSSDSWKILLVDDESEVHNVTKLALKDFTFEGKPLSFISAYSGEEAKAIITNNQDIAIILLDVIMETDNAGLDVVKYIRDRLKNKLVQIILRTGQPGQVPEDVVTFQYNINDYKTKTELTKQKLITVIVTSLREFETLYQADKARRFAEEKYFSIFENKNVLEGIYQSTPDGQYISVNPAMARIYGYDSPEEMMASVEKIDRQTYVDPSCRNHFKRLIEEKGEVKGFEYQVYRRDRSMIWVEENTRAVCDARGKPLYYEGIIKDITKRKQAENAAKLPKRKLKIEIDKTQKAQQVAEIAETNSFQKLKQQLKNIKNQKN